MHEFLNTPFKIGTLTHLNRLIQGPLAGFSCAPFRALYYRYQPPAYCVSEMMSATDVLQKHQANSRYLYRAPIETTLCYQLSGHDPQTIAAAAVRLQGIGADLIDLNCGCPKAKIRKKNAGSALLDEPVRLIAIAEAVRRAVSIPITVKLRIQGGSQDIYLAKAIEQAGVDAMIVHGRRWTDDYDNPCDYQQIAAIKQAVGIPVIANGDITNQASLAEAISITGCDAYMISRAGSGNPWLYQQLLAKPGVAVSIEYAERVACFMDHLYALAELENEHQAVMQSRSLVRYYFRTLFDEQALQAFYRQNSLEGVRVFFRSMMTFEFAHRKY